LRSGPSSSSVGGRSHVRTARSGGSAQHAPSDSCMAAGRRAPRRPLPSALSRCRIARSASRFCSALSSSPLRSSGQRIEAVLRSGCRRTLLKKQGPRRHIDRAQEWPGSPCTCTISFGDAERTRTGCARSSGLAGRHVRRAPGHVLVHDVLARVLLILILPLHGRGCRRHAGRRARPAGRRRWRRRRTRRLLSLGTRLHRGAAAPVSAVITPPPRRAAGEPALAAAPSPIDPPAQIRCNRSKHTEIQPEIHTPAREPRATRPP
jgi:hypothetical protein